MTERSVFPGPPHRHRGTDRINHPGFRSISTPIYLNNISSGTGPTLKYGGAAVTVGQFDPYVPVAVEQTAGGYQVALKYAAGNQFSIWNTDSNGNFVSFAVYAGNSATLKSLEISFQQDLNGDSAVGAAAITSQTLVASEGIGNAFLKSGWNERYVQVRRRVSQT